ncbi:MAG TPA: hypothetical protein VM264_00900 [Acidimicrobiales bacterium]|nr:hypothetical protein [Acidimicrobiales bacterium]
MVRKAAPVKKAAPGRKAMSDGHKAALAEGREQGRAVRRYLEALEQHRPKRGRKRTSEALERRLTAVEGSLAEAAPLDRLHLIQERLDLQSELAGMNDNGVDVAELKDAFVGAAAGYGARRGITYSAWRAAGVPPGVLRRAGISRSQ